MASRQSASSCAGVYPTDAWKVSANRLRGSPASAASLSRSRAWPGEAWRAVSARAKRLSARPCISPMGGGLALIQHPPQHFEQSVSQQPQAAAQAGESANPAIAAAVRLALKVVEVRGRVEAEDITALGNAGYVDAQIVEILTHVTLQPFTNDVTVAFAVLVDCSAIELRAAA